MCEAIEPRKLLASTFTGTDVDGDVYTVEVLGNGSAAVTTSGGGGTGFIASLILSGTDLKSTLKISVTAAPGDGEVELRDLVAGDLGTLDAAVVNDRSGGGWALQQVKSVIVGTLDETTVEISGPAAQKVSITITTLGETTMDCSQRVSELKVGTGTNAVLNLTAGVDFIRSEGQFVVDINVTAPGTLSIGKAVIGGVLDNDWTVSGGVGAVTAQSVDDGFDIRGATFIQSFKVAGQFNGQLRAGRMDTIVGLADGDVELFLGTGNAQGVALRTFKMAGAFTGLFDEFAPGTPAGAVKSMTVGSINGVSIKASGIDSLVCVGDALGLEIDTTAVVRAVSLGTVKIGGTLTGSATVNSPVKSFTAGKSNGFSLVDPSFAAPIGLVRFTSVDQSVIQVNAGTLVELRCAGTLTGSLDLRGEFGATGLSMRTLRTGRISGFTIANTTVGGLDALIANLIQSYSITLPFINRVDVREVAGDPERDGSIHSGSMTLTETRPGSPLSVSSLRMTGEFFSTSWTVFGGVGSLRAARIASNTFTARFINTLTVGRTPGTAVLTSASLNLNGVNASGRSLGTAIFKGSMEGASINIAGHVNSMGFNKLNSVSINMGSVGTWKVVPGNGFDGSVSSGTLTLNNPNTSGDCAGDMTFTRMTNFSVKSSGSIKSVTAETMSNLGLTVGVFPDAFFVFQGLNPLSGPVCRIGSINITRAFDVLNPAADRVFVTTHAITSLKINGFVQTNNGGNDFGFAAGFLGQIKMRDNLGAPLTFTGGIPPNEIRPVGGDFVIRVVS